MDKQNGDLNTQTLEAATTEYVLDKENTTTTEIGENNNASDVVKNSTTTDEITPLPEEDKVKTNGDKFDELTTPADSESDKITKSNDRTTVTEKDSSDLDFQEISDAKSDKLTEANESAVAVAVSNKDSNDDLNSQESSNAKSYEVSKANESVESEKDSSDLDSQEISDAKSDKVTKSNESVEPEKDSSDLDSQETSDAKSDKVTKANDRAVSVSEKDASDDLDAGKVASDDLDADLKDQEKHPNSQSSNDTCDKDNNSKNNKENQQIDLESANNKEDVISKNNEEENEENTSTGGDGENNGGKFEENSTDIFISHKRNILDESLSSLNEMVEPLVTKNEDADDADAIKDQDLEEEEEDNEADSKDFEHDESTSAINEDTDGEFEDVEIPDEVGELIVPDEGGEQENLINPDDDDDRPQSPPSNDDEITKDKDSELDETSNSKTPEDEASNDEHIESELVAIEETAKDAISSGEDQTTNDADADADAEAEAGVSNGASNDPLNCLETQTQHSGEDTNNSAESGAPPDVGDNNDDDNNSNAANRDEDEDDVEFVETRNSPICIESDEEDSRETDKETIITLPTATITIPRSLTVTRTSARKSTARPHSASSSPQTVPQQHSGEKLKRFSYLDKATTYRRSLPLALTIIPHQVVDTIELLDSSDEDSSLPAAKNSSRSSSSSTTMNLRTPPKRTLMAAKGATNKVPYKTSSLAARSGGGVMPNHFPVPIKQQSKKPAPPPLPPPTPQSNFLNNVQLQPAATGSNPPAFSALLSNKSVIIPNAFYGNPPNVRGNPADAELERRYVRWLENFITQFCNPQLVASHSCFVLLQRALKYKDFVRIKGIRTNLNVNAQKATDLLNHQLMLDLRAIFLKSSKEITPHGRRFCEMACSTPQNKTVTLLIHASTGRIIMKSCNMEVPIATTVTSSPSTSNNTANSSTATRKRQLEEDEYVPVNNKLKSSKPLVAYLSDYAPDEDEGPKRSLRSKRAKRLDNSFSYNEDDLAEYEIDDEEEAERSAQAEIQRKIDQKRLEAQTQRQQQAKSFENAFIQAFAKGIDGKEPNKKKQTGQNKKAGQRARLNNSLSSASVQQHLANNDAEDLLEATWIENVENEETQIISDDEEPRQHRIYKQMQLKQQQQQQQHQQRQQHRHQQMQLQHRSIPKQVSSNTRTENTNLYQQQLQLHARHWPKNTDIHLHAISKNKDICCICKLNVQRIVHHYVNEHRGSEVYSSRLTTSQIEHLRRGASTIFNVTLYKNGQPQYEAHCIFCQKLSRFMLPYWIHHFTMHTGEYAYRCSGCGLRKPTRSLLTQHHGQGCPQNGSVLQDYTHDTKKIRVEARICTLCNYVQLHRCNIVKHLHLQHGIKQILPKHIQTILLLKLDPKTEIPEKPETPATRRQTEKPPPARRQPQSFATSSSSSDNAYVIDDDDDDNADDNNNDDVDDNDDDDDDDDDDGDDDMLLFGDTIQSTQQQHQHQQLVDPNAQNYSYNYIPPYMMNANTNNIVWEDNDPAEDLSFMICGMLDVQTNNTE